MEHKVWNKTKIYLIIRYLAIIVLPFLLAFYIFKFKEFNEYLISLNPWHIVPANYWVLFTKFLSYCLHIGINFCILYAVSRQLRYSLWLVYVSFALLLLGALTLLFGYAFDIQLPAAIIIIFVKANKSLVLLVLFIAGYFVKRAYGKP